MVELTRLFAELVQATVVSGRTEAPACQGAERLKKDEYTNGSISPICNEKVKCIQNYSRAQLGYFERRIFWLVLANRVKEKGLVKVVEQEAKVVETLFSIAHSDE